MARNNLIQFRKGTLAQFNSANPTLASGEPGFATDAKVLKVGDGVTPWSGLLGFSVGSGISSLNGLTSSALVINGGHNIQVTTSGTEVISVAYTGIDHRVVPGLIDINNNGNTFIQDLLFDQFGHVTGVASVAVTGIGSGGSVPSNVLVSGDNISLLTNDADYDTIPTYNLTAAGSSAYLFNGPGLSASSSNPTLYFHRGHTYKFVNNMGAHPFQFQTTAGLGGTAYTNGITGSPVSNGTLTWEVRHDTPSTLYYQCTSHASMQGIVYILATGITSSVPSNVATTGELASVSGHLQGQIDSVSSATNTFVSGVVYNTGLRDLVLTRNDGVQLTGNLSSVLHSGDSISFLNNDTAYITGLIEDTSPKLGGNLDLNSNDITGNGDFNIIGSGIITETMDNHCGFIIKSSGNANGELHIGSCADSVSQGDAMGIRHSSMNGTNDFMILGDTDGATYISAKDNKTVHIAAGGNDANVKLEIKTGTPQFRFNVNKGNVDLQYNGFNQNNLLYLDAFTNSVGMGTNVPQTRLDVSGIITASGGNSTNWNTAYGWGDHRDLVSAVSGHLQTQIDASPTGHIDVSGATNNFFLQTEPNNIFVHDMFFDQYGHVTGVILAQASGFLNNDAFVTGVFFDSSRNLNLLLGGGAGSLSVNIPASGGGGTDTFVTGASFSDTNGVSEITLSLNSGSDITVNMNTVPVVETGSIGQPFHPGTGLGHIDRASYIPVIYQSAFGSVNSYPPILKQSDIYQRTDGGQDLISINPLEKDIDFELGGLNFGLLATCSHTNSIVIGQGASNSSASTYAGYGIDIALIDTTYIFSGQLGQLSVGGGAGSPNYTFPINDGSFGQALITDGAGNLSFANVSGAAGGGSGISNIVQDTNPQLGGDLDANGNNIDMGSNLITDTKVGQWDTAYGWGDHSTSGYLVSGSNISLLNNNVPYAISGSHIDVSGATNNYFLQTEPNNTFVHDLMFDTFGHVTGVILAQASGFLNDDAFVTGILFDSSRNLNLLLGGGAGTLSVNIPSSGSSSHPIIDAVASVDNSNNNFVQDLLFDTYGHVTGVVSAAVTGITSGGSAGDIYLTGVAFDTSTRNLIFSWNSGVSDITVNIPSSGGGSSGGGVLSSSGVNNILVASTGISIIHNTGTSKIQIGTTLNHTALHHFFQ